MIRRGAGHWMALVLLLLASVAWAGGPGAPKQARRTGGSVQMPRQIAKETMARIEQALDAHRKGFDKAEAAMRASWAQDTKGASDSAQLKKLKRRYTWRYVRLLLQHHSAVERVLDLLRGAANSPCRSDGTCDSGLTCIFGRCQLAHDAPHRGPGSKNEGPLPPRPKMRRPGPR